MDNITLSNFDVYRDGGSLSTSFKDEYGIEFTLFFPVHLVGRGPLDIEKIGYKLPEIEQFIKIEQVSSVTGRTNFEWDKKSTTITWDEARKILKMLSPQVEGFTTDYAEVFPKMVKIAEFDGQLC